MRETFWQGLRRRLLADEVRRQVRAALQTETDNTFTLAPTPQPLRPTNARLPKGVKHSNRHWKPGGSTRWHGGLSN